jgi:hypothetical protein
VMNVPAPRAPTDAAGNTGKAQSLSIKIVR